MTLNELPQEIHENIIEKLIVQSDTAQEARHELVNIQHISRQWRALSRHEVYAYKKYQQTKKKQQVQRNYISEAFVQRKENDKQRVHKIIERFNQLPPERYQDIFKTTKPDELGHFIHKQYDWLQAHQILEPLIIAYIHTGDFSPDCFDAFFALYKIYPETTTKEPLHIYDYVLFERVSKMLISYYLDASLIKDTVKKARATELLNKLQVYGLLQTNFDPTLGDIWTNNIKTFLRLSICTQQDITLLNKTIHLKKLLQYQLLQTLAAEYKKNTPLFNLKVVFICSIIAVGLSATLYKWRSLFAKLSPPAQEDIIKITFIFYWPLLNKLFMPPWKTIQAYKKYKKSDRYTILQHLKHNKLFMVKPA
jgi:hypothetical protein